MTHWSRPVVARDISFCLKVYSSSNVCNGPNVDKTETIISEYYLIAPKEQNNRSNLMISLFRTEEYGIVWKEKKFKYTTYCGFVCRARTVILSNLIKQ